MITAVSFDKCEVSISIGMLYVALGMNDKQKKKTVYDVNMDFLYYYYYVLAGEHVC